MNHLPDLPLFSVVASRKSRLVFAKTLAPGLVAGSPSPTAVAGGAQEEGWMPARRAAVEGVAANYASPRSMNQAVWRFAERQPRQREH